MAIFEVLWHSFFIPDGKEKSVQLCQEGLAASLENLSRDAVWARSSVSSK